MIEVCRLIEVAVEKGLFGRGQGVVNDVAGFGLSESDGCDEES
jgi:hypothetical protein